jgi:hypothetical protein
MGGQAFKACARTGCIWVVKQTSHSALHRTANSIACRTIAQSIESTIASIAGQQQREAFGAYASFAHHGPTCCDFPARSLRLSQKNCMHPRPHTRSHTVSNSTIGRHQPEACVARSGRSRRMRGKSRGPGAPFTVHQSEEHSHRGHRRSGPGFGCSFARLPSFRCPS